MRDVLQDILGQDDHIEIKSVHEDSRGDKTYGKVSKEEFASRAHIQHKAGLVAE